MPRTVGSKTKAPIVTPVPPPATDGVPSGRPLNDRAAQLIKSVEDKWELDDVARAMLSLAAENLTISDRIGEILEKEGYHYVDRWSQPRPHPLVSARKDFSNSASNILSRLRLDLG